MRSIKIKARTTINNMRYNLTQSLLDIGFTTHNITSIFRDFTLTLYNETDKHLHIK